ncbi:type II toxin-antitoxin system RelB/DinJ family antitoxin [Bifidobacterium sp. ESL0769]|uniref:type II toxin-antitoxin system RelB/DinJ family antitoxin n=1 Tax=Bifidobacterium sp. ESL0769 TaxID=2983229 RepID=UPI0023F950C6|nr:type II toxin-antitoxin system RelB/DinJ family antitoxin [Bifidobacterium sp. ESL0769]WEV67283.1 type II toxin-antitoxin system RelB/DinJ family antitoxin [Bifidobacterium sp. ESL0769]
MDMNARIQIRTNKELKEEATELLESIGLDLTTAINMTLKQIVNTRSLPFEPKAPTFENAVLSTMDEPVIAVKDDDAFARLIADA